MKPFPSEILQNLNTAISRKFGLNFPKDRLRELQKTLQAGTLEAKLPEDPSLLLQIFQDGLLSQEQNDILIRHFTIGETYFFREKASLEAFQTVILHTLMNERKGRDQKIRIWSAGCCTGEEPYTIAILMNKFIPDIENWDISIVATDINRTFLRKAVAGKYSQWSFRDTPPEILQQYFKPLGNEFQLIDEIKKMVRFEYLNLATDDFPSLSTPYHDIDVLFCRNVLMYFAPEQATRIGQQFFDTLSEKGWLITSPVEVSNTYFSSFTQINVQDAIFYRKGKVEKEIAPDRVLPVPLKKILPAKPGIVKAAVRPPAGKNVNAIQPSLLEKAKIHANLGKLNEARECMEQLLETDHMNAFAYYFFATILMELNEAQLAEQNLKRAIYLESQHLMAHFQMGNLARIKLDFKTAARHFSNVIELLKTMPSEEIVSDSDGMTAGRMIEYCNLLMKK